MGEIEGSMKDAIQVLIVAVCMGIILMIVLRIEESTAHRISRLANECYDQGKRAVLIHGEIQCR